jgi:hypothetical protein
MPLRKVKSGWMWGSKGPFPTKAKALQVARAAYASGYKEHDKIENTIQATKRFDSLRKEQPHA